MSAQGSADWVVDVGYRMRLVVALGGPEVLPYYLRRTIGRTTTGRHLLPGGRSGRAGAGAQRVEGVMAQHGSSFHVETLGVLGLQGVSPRDTST